MKAVRRLGWLVLLAALMLSACGSGAPAGTDEQAAKVLNLYGWSNYVPQQILDDFTTETGITVNYDTYSSNEEMLAKLQAGASGYDIVIPSDYTVAIMIKQGMLEPLDLAKVPNFSNLDPRYLNRDFDPGNQYSIPYQVGTTALAYDTTKVPAAPTKYADLWDPRYQGKLVLLDDEREVMAMALEVLGFDRNTTDESQLRQAEQKLIELKPNILQFNSDNPEAPLITGEAWAGLVYNGNAALAFLENPNIEYICPEEGCTIWIDTLAVPKGAPHKDSAMAFLNWVLDPEQSVLITEEFLYSSPNPKAVELLQTVDPETYEWFMVSQATNPSDAFLAGAKPIVDVGDATSLYDSLWTDFKAE